MSFTLGHANVQQPDPQSQRLQTIAVVARSSDVATFNEALKDHGAIDALLGFDDHTVGELAIIWRTAKFNLIAKGARQVMVGGRRGDGSPGDRRRRGPNRWVAWVVLDELLTGKRVIVATHHAIAKPDTSAKWRRPLRDRGFAGVVTELRAVRANHPDADLLLTGDLNTIGAITAFLALGVREAKTPPTYGKNLRYDRIWGDVSNVRVMATKADHRALLATVTLGDTATPHPPHDPPPNKPAGRPKPRRPHNPWSRKGRRIRRRNPRRWRRIRRAFRRWRRNHRRHP
jgi:hypothetical protein